VNSPIQDVWSIITDYNQLAVHVPNLVKSYVIPDLSSDGNPSLPTSMKAITRGSKVRIFQEGAQKIVGFDFRASLTMDMTEETENVGRAMAEKRTLYFKLAESGMFSSFDGNWSIRYHSRTREWDTVLREFVFRYKTMLTYSVLVKPKGPVPVIALEWRIKEDVPVNLMAMKSAAEKVTSNGRPQSSPSEADLRTEWGADETLGMYLGSNSRSETAESSWISRVNT
jgi:Polyketide cyclase / dehydrase and lipid transport